MPNASQRNSAVPNVPNRAVTGDRALNEISKTPTGQTTIDNRNIAVQSPIYFAVLFLVFSLSCAIESPQINDDFHRSENANATLNSFPLPTPMSPDMLCDRLVALKEIPYYPGETTEDPIYHALMNEGEKVIPCLIEKITDTTVIADPRIAPHVQNFTVGDAAVWMLLYKTKMEWQPDEMFPKKYARLWKTEGVYAYFAYVESLENRKALQNWWGKWWEQRRNS